VPLASAVEQLLPGTSGNSSSGSEPTSVLPQLAPAPPRP
jgi:hypothetical protein